MQRRSALVSFCALFCASVCSAVGIPIKPRTKPIQGAFVFGGQVFCVEGEPEDVRVFYHEYQSRLWPQYKDDRLAPDVRERSMYVQRLADSQAATGVIYVYACEPVLYSTPYRGAVEAAVAATGCRVVSPEALQSVF